MGRTLEEVIGSLPADERAQIEARTAELIELHRLRQRFGKTQSQVAEAMGVGQDTISRLERRGDMLLSTLSHYVESLGGTLELVVRLPGLPPTVIDPIGDQSKRPRKRVNSAAQ